MRKTFVLLLILSAVLSMAIFAQCGNTVNLDENSLEDPPQEPEPEIGADLVESIALNEDKEIPPEDMPSE